MSLESGDTTFNLRFDGIEFKGHGATQRDAFLNAVYKIANSARFEDATYQLGGNVRIDGEYLVSTYMPRRESKSGKRPSILEFEVQVAKACLRNKTLSALVSESLSTPPSPSEDESYAFIQNTVNSRVSEQELEFGLIMRVNDLVRHTQIDVMPGQSKYRIACALFEQVPLLLDKHFSQPPGKQSIVLKLAVDNDPKTVVALSQGNIRIIVD